MASTAASVRALLCLTACPAGAVIRSWIALVVLCHSAAAAEFSTQVADPDPLGIATGWSDTGWTIDGLADGIKGDIDWTLRAESVYDSNFFLQESDRADEWWFLLQPSMRYTSDPEGGAEAALVANCRPVSRTYVEHSGLDRIDHSGDVALTLRGAKTEAAVFARYLELSATDRLTGVFTEGSLLTTGARIARQVAPFTRAHLGASFATSDYDDSASNGAEVFSTWIGALHDATPRLGLGANTRFTAMESDTLRRREAWALLGEVRYRAGERIRLTLTAGPEFATLDAGDDDETSLRLSASLAASWRLNDRWLWIQSIRTASIPSPTTSDAVLNDLAWSTTLRRQLTRGSIEAGLEAHLTEAESIGTTANPDDDWNIAAFISGRRPLGSDRVHLDAALRHTLNRGRSDWDQWLVTIGLNVDF